MNNKIEELNKELDELQAKINEVQKKIEEAKQAEWPKCGDRYYYISSDNSVINICWHNDFIDRNHACVGNVFKTNEEAHFELESRKVTAELKKFAMTREEVWAARHNELVFYLFLDSDNDWDITHDCSVRTPGVLYFKNRDIAQEAVEAVGEERIKKYYFGVED